MKRRSCGNSFRDSILGPTPGAELKRKKLQLLLEELSKPEIDVGTLSQHTSMMFAKMQQQNIMIIPQLIRQLQRQGEPLVLEITKNEAIKRKASGILNPDNAVVHGGEVVPEEVTGVDVVASESNVDIIDDTSMLGLGTGMESSDQETRGSELESLERGTAGEKQFEIIFSDSAQPSDGDMGEHIIHSTTERTAGTSEATSGTVNVPNSFPLFQIVHTGEVPEDLQQEIVRLIRQANPELDLNSITFKFKSPETVEIIANINT